MRPEGAEFGLYIHWPFCQAKCPYCDFNSHVWNKIDQGRWADAYIQELERVSSETSGQILHSVFFGGGTPSLMEEETVRRILDRVRSLWTVANDWEVTLEANPTSVEAGRFAAYRDAGVNRISVGIQSLIDDDLRRLGRLHSADEGRKALETARKVFDQVSFDLMYARQDQSLDAWEKELLEALALAGDHLSLYQLTIEPGTAFGARHAVGGLAGLPDEALSADQYELTLRRAKEHGFEAYEVSNFARNGSRSRHNMIYWSGGDYVGIGPGAHGRLTLEGRRWATEAILSPRDWLTSVQTGSNEQESRHKLSPADQAIEYILMGLRTVEGVSLGHLAQLGSEISPEPLVESGHLRVSGDRLVATSEGRLLLNHIVEQLIQV